MLRFGLLGAARITPVALLRPAASRPGVSVTAVAARSVVRARRFAARFDIPRAYGDYAALIDDDAVDAVYIALPHALHATWTRRALEAGKHVLCEKPLAMSAREADAIMAMSAGNGRVALEAMAYQYSAPLARVSELLHELGALRHVDATFRTWPPAPWNFRYRRSLGGGTLSDLGVYCLHATTLVGQWCGERDTPRIRTTNTQYWGGVDLNCRATLDWRSGATASIHCGFNTRSRELRVECDGGSVRITNPFLPHDGHRITLTRNGTTTTEQTPVAPAYNAQLDAFVRAVDAPERGLRDLDTTLSVARLMDEVRSRDDRAEARDS